AWEDLLDQVAYAPLMDPVRHRPQEADSDGLDALLGKRRQQASHRLFIQWLDDIALRVDALGDLESQAPRDVRVRKGDAEVEPVELSSFTEDQGVGNACCGEKRRPRGLSFEDRIRRFRRRVHEYVRLGEK